MFLALLDLCILSFVSALILLSLLSLCFIFHLRLKSKSLLHLQDFNSLWTVRFLLVLFIFFWALSQLLLPLRLFSFLSPIPLPRQAELCRLHIVLSLGFFQPAFLVTLLFLLNASIRKKTPNDSWAISFVLLTCLPISLVHLLFILLRPYELRLPLSFHQTSVVRTIDDSGIETVLCAYPLLNSIVFAAFGVSYGLWFLCSTWKVLSLVINKGLRIRIYGLAFAVLGSLTVQIVFLGVMALWNPDEDLYSVATLVVFLSALCSATAGEGILVIKPISDALDAGGKCCQIPSEGGQSRRSTAGVGSTSV
ncbi:uncharacterized protein LOC114746641 [Neltuma alba]|uniref:uncharacterized protein LOC114746641 n=1 Tax=Neltuma alba TaxID=207710 RepID=UPI0010A2B6DE|nr:uncharacterized protein LOC114746641 [Prosopis alba]